MLSQYQLGQLYAGLRRAVRSRRWPEASHLLAQALGMELPGQPTEAEIAAAAGSHLVRQLSYRGFKPAELTMVVADLKPVVKLEDIPIEQARRFAARTSAGRKVLIGEAYRKDYLLLRSDPCSPDDPNALVCVFVSAGDQAAELAKLENTAREDAQAAGQLLGFPKCCVDAFCADFERSRVDQDTINDDAVRRMLAEAAPPTFAPWKLNPLADGELLGFFPCRANCPEALQRADRVIAAMEGLRPDELERIHRRLNRPALFWRLPFFAVARGVWRGPVLYLRELRVNAFADREVRAAQALLAAHLTSWLQPGCGISVEDGQLVRWRGDRRDGRLAANPGSAPLLCGWRDE